jgi:ADP-ribosylation factor protein 1
MGNTIFLQFEWIWKSFHRDTSIIVLGLDNAGKTAILYSLKLGEAMPYTVPTIGFNLEEIHIGKLNVKMWDIGGQDKIRALWPHYFVQTDAVAFVIDSNDRDRFDIAKKELHTLISHKELTGKPFLILANKQDLPYAAKKQEIKKAMQLDIITSSPIHIVECSATKNDKAKLGFEWIAEHL